MFYSHYLQNTDAIFFNILDDPQPQFNVINEMQRISVLDIF